MKNGRECINNFINSGFSRQIKIDPLIVLMENLQRVILYFDKDCPFRGPSIYFHDETIKRFSFLNCNIEEAFNDAEFLARLYATLACWGMHRMGNRANHMVEFADFQKTLKKFIVSIQELQDVHITDIADGYGEADNEVIVDTISDKIWEIIRGLVIAHNEAHLVAGTKVLHHLLPQLVPPIDRTYSLKMFYENTYLYCEQEKFRQLFRCYFVFAYECKKDIERILSEPGHIMNTSITKVMDNAIVGYLRKNEKFTVRNSKNDFFGV